LQWLFVNSDDGWVYRTPLVVVAALLSFLLLLWFRRLPFQATREETLHEALEHQTAAAVAK
ncbi:MAG: hypothetical protein QGF59_24610, partial [Pirellulaceae bacterium]|nr:hypothetical protein [Pirellulaceae bacterium]